MALVNIRSAAAVICFLAWGTTVINAWGPRSACVDIYNAKPTDSCASITAWSGLTAAQLEALNPDLHDCGPPMDVQRVCLRYILHTYMCRKPDPHRNQLRLSARWELTVADFVALNDNVDDACDDLAIGQPYCVSPIDCYPGNTDPDCDIS
ncbi:hypothetical protein PHLGIDRAFT_481353 [Phlebiopsis gigantea 11061_1 CR5-6]|uniref:LysM domain-containing protein n=1 Tax=Phlebiopsis gigantea (strain 11061_1 CR5-6) TaxID=745531 RepID=A0A0C3RWH9_PHLG1|nr:hypothetical protein PHLGIDRAFT_481353 [Phlebiopsis gigantea 11061_1 CR5-6]